MNNNSPEKQLVDKISTVSNILVTVSHNPTVDQLVSALGLSLALNKLNKRAVAVYSGKTPDVLKFLHPEKTFENNADSLRDFIISLSKDKADRIKVLPEGDFAKIYITPYRSRITPDDLKFSDGDFNIELIIAIGVADRNDLDASIASHGKIFHDAVTATINTIQIDDVLGNISWQNSRYTCYSEMTFELVEQLLADQPELIDDAIATAFLTGVVASTDQFSNSITTPQIMNLSAKLMSHGANQQLIASELENFKEQVEPVTAKPRPAVAPEKKHADIKLEHPELVSYGEIEDPIERRLKEDRDNFGRAQSFNALQAAHAELMGVQQDNMVPANDNFAPSAPSMPATNSTPAPTKLSRPTEIPRVSGAVLDQIPDKPDPSQFFTPHPAPQPLPQSEQSPYGSQTPPMPIMPPAPALDVPQRNEGSNMPLPPLPPLPQSEPQPLPQPEPTAINAGDNLPPTPVLPPLPPATPVNDNGAIEPLPPAPVLPPLPQPEPTSQPEPMSQPMDMPLPPIPPAPVDNNLGSLPPIPPAPQISTPDGLPPIPPLPPAPSANEPSTSADNFSLPPIPPAPTLPPAPAGDNPNPAGEKPRDPSQFVIPSM